MHHELFHVLRFEPLPLTEQERRPRNWPFRARMRIALGRNVHAQATYGRLNERPNERKRHFIHEIKLRKTLNELNYIFPTADFDKEKIIERCHS